MARKRFFVERNPKEMQNLNLKTISNPKGLVDIIEELDSEKEGIILEFPLVHPEFANEGNPQYISRKTLRGVKRIGDKRFFPSYIKLEQPRSVDESVNLFNRGILPFKIRNKSFFDSMANIPEEQNFNVGYMVWPVIGNDKSPMLVPFWSIAEGCMIDSYNSRICKGENGSRVERVYGSEVIVKIPSRNKKSGRYVAKFSNVPNRKMSPENKAVVGWNTKPAYGRMIDGEFVQDESASPIHKLTNVSHEGSHRRGESFQFTMIYPHCVAGYQSIIRNAMREGDFSPLEMSQFAILSRDDAAFYQKVRNNILIAEKNDSGDYILKYPRIDQKSMIISRRVGNNIRRLNRGEVQKTMYWDAERDGKISDYPFLLGKK
jgi:hypothetical protein